MRAPGSRATAIPQISMKFCQFKGSTPKLKQATWFLFWLFSGVENLIFRWVEEPKSKVFTEEIASK